MKTADFFPRVAGIFEAQKDFAMNCEVAHEKIVTAAYVELPDEEAHELERHVAGCRDCQNEREQLLALKVLANAYPVVEPGPNLIARSRLRLEEALDALPPMRWYQRMAQRAQNNFASLRAAPVAALLLLVAGGGIGILAGYEFAVGRSVQTAPNTGATAPVIETAVQESPAGQAAIPEQQTAGISSVANVVSIERQPDSQMVEVRYSRLVPERIRGSLDDPMIRQLLMVASENAASVGVRDHSVALMADECRAAHGCQPSGIRDALMVSLLYDNNPGVRMTALQGLEPYVSRDLRVRDAVLEALLNDSDPAIRSTAISILEPVEADTSVRQVLSTVANSDSNPQIRTVSREVLSRAPMVQ
ncbi:MAG TPA: HEAT repeat domain-containing protein [Terracidiphilus sp.]|nr:HEAT repeat domain-containing protein [Terracidiphilus sp.]